jgi:PAS domain S-box-containing protein
MPRYYFHVLGPDGLESDETGVALPGLEAALREARRAAPGVMGELIDQGRSLSSCGFRITTSTGRLVMDIPFIDLGAAGPRSHSFAPRPATGPCENLRAPPSIYQGVFEAVPAPIVILDLQLRVIVANTAYLEATGAKADELKGRCICQAFPRNPSNMKTTDGSGLLALFDRALSLGHRDEAHTLRYDIRGSDGAWRKRFWRPSSWPIADENGAVVALASQMLDVTVPVELGLER